jgi:hypothetical protein
MIYQITLRHIPEQRSIRNLRYENIKPGTSEVSLETCSYHIWMILSEGNVFISCLVNRLV